MTQTKEPENLEYAPETERVEVPPNHAIQLWDVIVTLTGTDPDVYRDAGLWIVRPRATYQPGGRVIVGKAMDFDSAVHDAWTAMTTLPKDMTHINANRHNIKYGGPMVGFAPVRTVRPDKGIEKGK